MGIRLLIPLVLLCLALAFRAARGAEVRFGRERGICDAPFALELTGEPEGAAVRYTLDGSEPTGSRGLVYREAIPIERSTVVRAVAVDAGGSPGATRTHTYIFPDRVADQPPSPPGWVTSFISERHGPARPHAFDYGLDPEVLAGAGRDALAASLRELPSLSLALAVDDFNLLYRSHRMRGAAWERPGSVELIYPNHPRFAGFAGFQVDCGARMQGGLAVDQARKKSFRLLFKTRYGPGKLRYPVFESAVHHGDSGARRFDTLVLRAGGNANWSKDIAYKHAPTTYLRDQLVRDSEIAMHGLGARGIFVHLYVNGLYFGLYNVTERPDARFLATYLGGDESEWCSVNHGGLVSGDPAQWSELLGLAALGRGRADAGARLRELLDVDGFCDYVLLNWCVGMGDWPYNNWYAGGPAAESGRFRFLCWDGELAFWAAPGYHHSSPGAWVHPLFASIDEPLTLIWRALERDPEFLVAFADRVHRHCGPGGALSDERMRKRFEALARRVEGAILAESARWGDAAWGQEDLPRTRERDWEPNRDAVVGMMRGNADRFTAALRAAGYYPRLDPPVVERLSVPLASGVAVRIRNPNRRGEVLLTLDGADPRLAGGGVAPGSRVVEGDGDGRLVLEETTRVKARVRAGREWSALADRLMLVEGDTLPLRITELMYHPPDGEEYEFIEIRNASAAPLDLTGVFLDGVEYWFAPGETLAGGAAVVLVPDDDPDAFRKKYPGAAVHGVYRGGLSNGGEELRILDAEGRTVTAVRYDDEGGWPPTADGGGHSLELVDLADPSNDLLNWRASPTPGGTP